MLGLTFCVLNQISRFPMIKDLVKKCFTIFGQVYPFYITMKRLRTYTKIISNMTEIVNMDEKV